uniref:E3 ubiquitin-protein ligase RNF25 n=1 Tax=Crassostrea virginica TaxID=6565 RepID=A0A8B8ELR9_CRAVI|nr:uncharacterized protein LOC111135248 isoform X2 [Crassostrea virginica]
MADDVEDSGIDEELEVLKSIYIEELNLILSKRGWPEVISLQLHPSTGDDVEKKYVCITLELRLSQQYPDEIPIISIKNPRGIGEEEVDRLQKSLVTQARELQGGPMLYDLIELAKESLTEGNIPHCPCTICYEHFHEGEDFTKTTCYHYFHTPCLSRYIRHLLEDRHQESLARPSHQQGQEEKESQTKVPCPVCREDIECGDDLLTGEVSSEEQVLTFDPSAELRSWQEEMSHLLRRQREKGGVIDVQQERNKFLITEDDVVELTKDHGIESSIKGHERESSPKSQRTKSSPKSQEMKSSPISREIKSPTKGHVAKEAGNFGKAEVHMKSKNFSRETTFKAGRLKERIGQLEREVDRRWTGFSEEFEHLNRQGAPVGSRKEGQRAENRLKNRVKHLVPYDSSRVILRDGDPEVKGSDYINASYIQIGSERNGKDGDHLIATQGCLMETVGDFWRMVWQERSQVIAMATKAVEDERVKVACYWCEEGEERLLGGQLYKFHVQGKSLTHHRDYILREMEVTKLSQDNQEEGTRLVYQFNFTAWPDFGVPRNPDSVVQFLTVVNNKQEELAAPGPIIIHCSAGIGRTGTLVVLEKLIHQIKQEGLDCDLDVQKTVMKVRSQRSGMVQTESQYKFVYRALLSYLNAQPGFTSDKVEDEDIDEIQSNKESKDRYTQKDRKGHGRVKQYSWRERGGKNYREEGRETHRTRSPSERSQGSKARSPSERSQGSKTNTSVKEHEDKKSGRNSQERRGFGKPQSSKWAETNETKSKGAETNETKSNRTVSSEQDTEKQGAGVRSGQTDQHTENQNVGGEKSQAERPRHTENQNVGGEKSRAERPRHTENQNVGGEKSRAEQPRQGFGRPRSGKGGRTDARHSGSGTQSSPRGQENQGDDRNTSTNTGSKQVIRRPEGRECGGREEIPRGRGKGGRGKGGEGPGGGNSGGTVGDRSPRVREQSEPDKKQTSAGNGGKVRTDSDHRERSDKNSPQGSNTDNRDSSDRLIESARGDKDTRAHRAPSPRADNQGRGRGQRRGKPRVPPGFNVSGPPPGFSDPIGPPPGFTDIS